MKDKIFEAQKCLDTHQIDGWLIYDFHQINPLGLQFLDVPKDVHFTRRFFYWIPAKGDPIKIVHQIEPHVLNHLPGEKRTYLRWKDLEELLKETLKHMRTIAMEYSPFAHVPTVSKIDGGTIELVKSSHHLEIISSAPFLQFFTAVLDDEQYGFHKEAAGVLEETIEKAWDWIAFQLKSGKKIFESNIQAFIVKNMEKNGCVFDGKPICAVGIHSSDPHYEMHPKTETEVKKGDFILIDLSCKRDVTKGIYADITRVGIIASKPTDRQKEIFKVVQQAQQAALDFVKRRFEKKQIVKGFEVDEVCRKVIEDAGFGEFFIHRTGHNIGEKIHGDGTNLDGFEILDDRPILPRTIFTIEPGIYLPGEFGIRLEYDVFIHESGDVEITTGIQEGIKCIDLT